MISDTNSYLIYLIDKGNPCILDMTVLYCNPDIREFIHKSIAYVDWTSELCLIDGDSFRLDADVERQLGEPHVKEKVADMSFIYLEGLGVNSSHRRSLLKCSSQEQRDRYIERILLGLSSVVAEVANKIETTRVTQEESRKLINIKFI